MNVRKNLLVILALSLFGLVDSEFLTHLHLRPELQTPLCALSSCDAVLASPYSVVLGVSLPSLGCLYYALVGATTLALMSSPGGARQTRLMWVLVGLSGLGAISSLVLVGLQAFIVHAFCLFCTLSALCCLTLCAWARPARLAAPLGDAGLARRCLAVWLIVGLGSPLTFGWLVKPKELAAVDTSLGHCLGTPSAGVQVIVFSDFQCPYCRKLFVTLLPLVQHNQERVFLCYRAFPMPAHERAWEAAAAAEAAGLQGHYWEYAQLLFQGGLDDASLGRDARQLGLDVARFETDRHSAAVRDRLNGEIEDARQAKIAGVPALFLNRVQRPAEADSLARMLP